MGRGSPTLRRVFSSSGVGFTPPMPSSSSRTEGVELWIEAPTGFSNSEFAFSCAVAMIASNMQFFQRPSQRKAGCLTEEIRTPEASKTRGTVPPYLTHNLVSATHQHHHGRPTTRTALAFACSIKQPREPSNTSTCHGRCNMLIECAPSPKCSYRRCKAFPWRLSSATDAAACSPHVPLRFASTETLFYDLPLVAMNMAISTSYPREDAAPCSLVSRARHPGLPLRMRRMWFARPMRLNPRPVYLAKHVTTR